jgi:iron complex outermembrane receptor protein
LLEAETSTSTSIGLIWQPEFAGLSVSVDYFDIDVRDEVDKLSPDIILSECYESDFGFAFGNSEPLCRLFDRTSVNFGVDNVRDSFLNIAQQTNRGIDYALQYDTDAGNVGDWTFELRATRTIEDTRALFADTVEDLNGLVGDPEWVGNIKLSLLRGPWSFYYSGNWVGETDSTRDNGKTTVTYRSMEYNAMLGTDDVFYHNLSVGYDWESTGLSALIGIANIANEDPPQITTQATADLYDTIGNVPFYTQYDWYGRRIFANLSYSFE